MRECFVPKDFNSNDELLIEFANTVITDWMAQGFTLTLRQIYYQYVANNVLPNTENSYKKVGKLLNQGRLAGLIDWDAIEDRTRSMRFNSHWDSPADIIDECASSYRIDLWETQKHRPEVWIEKDALIGVVEKACGKWDVPYFSCRGYVSQSAMYQAGKRVAEYIANNQVPIIFHLGDHDPSGINMSEDMRDRLEMFADEPVALKRIALNLDQVKKLSLPPNPAKFTDSRYKQYVKRFGITDCWELDALSPSYIVKLIEASIQSIIKQGPWNEANKREKRETEELREISENYEDVREYILEDDDEIKP